MYVGTQNRSLRPLPKGVARSGSIMADKKILPQSVCFDGGSERGMVKKDGEWRNEK